MPDVEPQRDEDPSGAALDGAEIRRRAVRGGLLLAGRGVVLRLVGLGGYFLLAALLSPQDFGLLALGLGLVFFAHFLTDAGIGAALMRAPQRPSASLLRAVLGVQLMVATVIALFTFALSFLIAGEAALVTAIQVGSVPILVFRLPGALLLERELKFGPIAITEVVEVVVYNLVAIGLVLAGVGVVGVALAALVKSVAGVLLMWRYEPAGRLWPSTDVAAVKPLLAFGAKFQAGQLTAIVRDQGAAVGVASIASLAVLGVYSLSNRLLSVPVLAFESLGRVSFPAMARLIEIGEEPRRAIRVSVSFASIVIGAIVTVISASSFDLLPSVLGAEWSDAAKVVVLACLGTAFAGPVSLAVTGYLLAVGDVNVVLRAAVANTAGVLVVGLALLPWLGTLALGIGLLVSMTADTTVLSRQVRERLDLGVVRIVFPAVVAHAVAVLAVVAISTMTNGSVVVGLVSVIAALGVYCLLLPVLSGAELRQTLAAVRRLARSGTQRRAEAPDARSGLVRTRPDS